MDKFIVEGGIPLRGEISASGSKNAALPIIAAALMANGPSVIRNVPRLRDTATMVRILAHMGARTRFENGTLEIDPRGINTFTAPYEFVSTMRASARLMTSPTRSAR